MAVPLPVPKLMWVLCATWDSPLVPRNLGTTLSWKVHLPFPNSPCFLPPHRSATASLPCRNQHSMKSDATGGHLDRTGTECPNVQWIQPRVRQACYRSQQTAHLGFYSCSQKPCLYKRRTSWFGRDLDNLKLYHKFTPEPCPEGYTKQSLSVLLLAITCPVTTLFLPFLSLPTLSPFFGYCQNSC